jgi:hypothetical protein
MIKVCKCNIAIHLIIDGNMYGTRVQCDNCKSKKYSEVTGKREKKLRKEYGENK